MKTQKRGLFRMFLVGTALLLSVAVILLAGVRLVTGKSLGLRSMVTTAIYDATNTFKLLQDAPYIKASSRGNFENIIFLHHSTGNNLLNQGGLRDAFAERGFTFWDHSYNRYGLRGPGRKGLGYSYNVPGDNTDPDGMAAIFRQPAFPLPVNTFSALMQHEVIIIKSCFEPGNNITSDAQLEQYKAWYLEMRAVMDAHPDRLFIIMTMPPLNPFSTNPEQAARARSFAEWQSSEEFLGGHANIATFDFYGLLAEDDPNAADANMLRAEYRNGADSHPNRAANAAIAPLFTDFVIEKIEQYRSALAKK